MCVIGIDKDKCGVRVEEVKTRIGRDQDTANRAGDW
jgi:hypothetical protein